jgi:hypothetical protein
MTSDLMAGISLLRTLPDWLLAPFGSLDWRCFLPELHLALETEPLEKELPALAQLTDPDQYPY